MRGVALLAFVATLWVHGSAHADPQWNAGLLTGACGLGARSSYWQDSCWYNGARADVLFGRNRYSDVSAGPYLSVTTAGFDDLRAGGGATVLLPITQYLPLGVSAGAHARHADGELVPGLSGWLFFGSRSFNFHSSYVMAGGILLGMERDLSGPRQNTLVVAAQIDGLVLALPFILGYEWLAGRDDEDD